jgi:hypothetical protein
MTDAEEKLLALRLELGRQIECENDTEGTPDGALSEAESRALLLAIVDDRDRVAEAEAEWLFARYERAKREWLTLRATLVGLVAVSRKGKQVAFHIGRRGREYLRANPRLGIRLPDAEDADDQSARR